MPITQDEIVRILDLLDQSSYEELDLETGDFKLVVRKSGARPVATPAAATPAAAIPAAAIPAAEGSRPAQVPDAGPATAAAPGSAGVRSPAPARAVEGMADGVGLVAVKSPLLGTLYRAPKPGAPAFVEVGSQVSETDTVCLIEVMKTYTTVTAGVSGRVVKICAENTQLVEYEQILFLVKPE